MQPQARPVTINGVAYPSQAAAARELGVTEHRIRAWIAEYGDTFAVDDIASYRPRRRHVVAATPDRADGRARPIEIDGVTYTSQSEAARALGVTRQAISLQVKKAKAMIKVHIQRASGTDGFRLVGEWDNGGESELPGWYGGQQEAVDAARASYPDAKIVGLTAEEGGRDSWRVADWLYDAARQAIDADATDEELSKLADQYADDADRENVDLDGDILDYLREVRDGMCDE